MKLFIVNCINVIFCNGDGDINDEQLGVFTSRELAEEFITTLPQIIGNDYWYDHPPEGDGNYHASTMQLARYDIKELVATNEGTMPWGTLSSHEEDRIISWLVDDKPEHISHPLCPHCNYYHSENDPHIIDDDLPF